MYIFYMPGKYIVITGGVLSSLGKGVCSASLGRILESMGYRVAMLKLDPYLNIDPGTMNPLQHGEVFVTDDGSETDLDLGHYSRFTNSPLSSVSNMTSGKVYHTVIQNERKGVYLGKTVQVIPHITDEIKRRITLCYEMDPKTDIVLCEIGGTVGDIESSPILEAVRQFEHEKPEDSVHIHLSYIPYIEFAKEVKTKPTQHSIQQLQRSGIFTDIILCRSALPLEEEIKKKISLFCNVPVDSVFDLVDVKNSIYEVPINLNDAGVGEKIVEKLNLKKKKANLNSWKEMIHTMLNPKYEITIGLCGKYLKHGDSYICVFEALTHAGIANKTKVNFKLIDSEQVESDQIFRDIDGLLVPGGFGSRGITGKLQAIKYARENKLPFFGICLGMQMLVVEFARNVLGLSEAHSTEMSPMTKTPVISLLSEQREIENIGGTMRLGAYECLIEKDSKAYLAYEKTQIFERHRHRYEFNDVYKELLQSKGCKITGINPKTNLAEICEISDHPWMLGCQFHPEFKSKPDKAHPLFKDFIKAALQRKKKLSTRTHNG